MKCRMGHSIARVEGAVFFNVLLDFADVCNQLGYNLDCVDPFGRVRGMCARASDIDSDAAFALVGDDNLHIRRLPDAGH